MSYHRSAWMYLYATEADVPLLRDLINEDEDLAFVVPQEGKRWHAVSELPELNEGLYEIWHVPSGPLPLYSRNGPWFEPIGWADDPRAGWPHLFFVNGLASFRHHAGVFTLNLRTSPREEGSSVGVSFFFWPGKKSISPETSARWRRLRKQLSALGPLVPRPAFQVGARGSECYALPDALRQIERGAKADQHGHEVGKNPFASA